MRPSERSAPLPDVPVTDLGSWCTCTLADVTHDGTVDGADLSYLQSCFGKLATGGCLAADLDNNGLVNIRDLACVAKMSGSCPPRG